MFEGSGSCGRSWCGLITWRHSCWSSFILTVNSIVKFAWLRMLQRLRTRGAWHAGHSCKTRWGAGDGLQCDGQLHVKQTRRNNQNFFFCKRKVKTRTCISSYMQWWSYPESLRGPAATLVEVQVTGCSATGNCTSNRHVATTKTFFFAKEK